MSLDWNQTDINRLVKLYTEGKSLQAIATGLGRSRSSVKMYVQRHRHELHLPPRIEKTSTDATSIDKQWWQLMTRKWSRI